MDVFKMSAGLKLAQLTEDLLDTSSDEGQPRRERGGSLPGKAENVKRDRRVLGYILYRQYFATNPIYDHSTFRRRFRVSRSIFNRFFNAVVSADDYFVQKRDCTGLLGLSPFQKLTAAMRMMAYGTAADSLDDKLGLSQTTAMECMSRFCNVVIDTFGSEYMRNLTAQDIRRILSLSEKRGFPGMLGSIDLQ